MSNFQSSQYGKSSVFKRNQSQKSFFQDLSQNENLKIKTSEDALKHPISSKFSQSVSILKKRVLDLKCKLSSLQSEKTRSNELKQQIKTLSASKYQKENMGVKHLEELMRKLSRLKGETEEQKMLLSRQKTVKEQKENDISKMEELIEAKNEEFLEVQNKVMEMKEHKNSLLANIDSNEKSVFLIGEEITKVNLENVRLDRKLKELNKEHNRLQMMSEKIQENFENKNHQLEFSEDNNKSLKEVINEIKKKVNDAEHQRNELKNEFEHSRTHLQELKNQREALRKQIRNFETVNQKKHYDINEFLEEQQLLIISNK